MHLGARDIPLLVSQSCLMFAARVRPMLSTSESLCTHSGVSIKLSTLVPNASTSLVAVAYPTPATRSRLSRKSLESLIGTMDARLQVQVTKAGVVCKNSCALARQGSELTINGAGKVGCDGLGRPGHNFLKGSGLQLPAVLGVQHPVPHKAQLLPLSCVWQIPNHSDNAFRIHACSTVPARTPSYCRYVSTTADAMEGHSAARAQYLVHRIG